MLRHKYRDDRKERLRDIYEFLLREFVPVLGYPAKIGTLPKGEKRSVWGQDGSLHIRLPSNEKNGSSHCLMLSPEASQDKLCRKLSGEFFRLCKNAVELSSEWDVKAHFIRSSDFIWDDLIVSLGLSGNQKYECIDILHAIRDSLLFEYEGSAVQVGVIVTWNLHNTREKFKELNCSLLKFQKNFDLQDSLRSTKFLNRISNTRSSIILVSKDALASHLVLVPNEMPLAVSLDWEFVPSNVQRPRSFLIGRDILICGTQHNELFLAGPDHVFKWGHKKWSRVSGQSIASVLEKFTDQKVAKSLTDVVVAMSQAKMGALFVVANDVDAVLKGAKSGLSKIFEKGMLFNIKDVDKWSLVRFASTDGATVISNSGQVLESGAILAIPETLSTSGEGARTVAAVFASKYGVAVKISDDGPVAIYINGLLVRIA
jgi:hypothetical protein